MSEGLCCSSPFSTLHRGPPVLAHHGELGNSAALLIWVKWTVQQILLCGFSVLRVTRHHCMMSAFVFFFSFFVTQNLLMLIQKPFGVLSLLLFILGFVGLSLYYKCWSWIFCFYLIVLCLCEDSEKLVTAATAFVWQQILIRFKNCSLCISLCVNYKRILYVFIGKERDRQNN